MENRPIDKHTRILGLDQIYKPLVIRDVTLYDPDTDKVWGNGMESVWYPSESELAALNAGEPVRVRLVGVNHPPINVFVGMNEEK